MPNLSAQSTLTQLLRYHREVAGERLDRVLDFYPSQIVSVEVTPALITAVKLLLRSEDPRLKRWAGVHSWRYA